MDNHLLTISDKVQRKSTNRPKTSRNLESLYSRTATGTNLLITLSITLVKSTRERFREKQRGLEQNGEVLRFVNCEGWYYLGDKIFI